MSISGIGLKFYQNNVTATKSTKSINGTEETSSVQEVTEAEEMAAFKKILPEVLSDYLSVRLFSYKSYSANAQKTPNHYWGQTTNPLYNLSRLLLQ